jgi:hypothetical protein
MAAVSAVLSGEAKVPFRCSRILQLAGAASLAIETPELDELRADWWCLGRL